jgi:hypothetical protein
MWCVHGMSNCCILMRRWEFLTLALSVCLCHGSPSLDRIKQMRVSSQTLLWKTKKGKERMTSADHEVQDLTIWQFWPLDLTTDLRCLGQSGCHHITRTCDWPCFFNDRKSVVTKRDQEEISQKQPQN